MKNSSRIHYFDFIRVLSISFMVTGHTVVYAENMASFVYNNDFNNIVYYIFSFMHIFRFGIVILFFISGSILLNPKREFTTTLWLKSILRIFLGLLIFSVLYRLLRDIFWTEYGVINGAIKTTIKFFSIDNIKIVLFDILTCHFEAGNQLWFSYVILIIYIFIPLLKILVKNTTKNQLFSIIFITFIALCIVPVIWALFNDNFVFSNTTIEKICFGFIGYLLGYWITTYLPKHNYIKILSLIIFILFTIITYIFNLKYFDRLNWILEYTNFVQAISFFIWMSYSQSKFNILSKFSKYMYGIYLINGVWYFCPLYSIKVFIYAVQLSHLWVILIVALTNIFLSFICVYLLRKIPFIRKYIF